MTEYPICLVGAGRIARVHARSIGRSRRATLVAVVDPNGQAASEIAKPFGAEIFSSLEESIKYADVAGVIVASPTDTHADYIELCVSHQIPVLCEKPVDLTQGRVDQCWRRIKDTNVPVTIGFHRRADAARREMKAALSSGQIGRPEHVLQISRDRAPPPPAFLAHSGGIVRDMLIHDLDELIWLFGDAPMTVTARLEAFRDQAYEGVADHEAANVTIAYENGPYCHITASRHCSYGFDQRLEIFGSRGLLSCPNHAARHVGLATDAGFMRGPLHESFADRYALAYETEFESFIDSVVGIAAPLCTVEEAGLSLALAELVMAANRSGSSITVKTLR